MANKHRGQPLPPEMTAHRRSITSAQYSVRRFVESARKPVEMKEKPKWASHFQR